MLIKSSSKYQGIFLVGLAGGIEQQLITLACRMNGGRVSSSLNGAIDCAASISLLSHERTSILYIVGGTRSRMRN